MRRDHIRSRRAKITEPIEAKFYQYVTRQIPFTVASARTGEITAVNAFSFFYFKKPFDLLGYALGTHILYSNRRALGTMIFSTMSRRLFSRGFISKSRSKIWGWEYRFSAKTYIRVCFGTELTDDTDSKTSQHKSQPTSVQDTSYAIRNSSGGV